MSARRAPIGASPAGGPALRPAPVDNAVQRSTVTAGGSLSRGVAQRRPWSGESRTRTGTQQWPLALEGQRGGDFPPEGAAPFPPLQKRLTDPVNRGVDSAAAGGPGSDIPIACGPRARIAS